MVSPLKNGDEFAIRYVAGQARTHQLELDRPTPRQLDRYQERTIRQHQNLNHNLSARQAKCRVDVAYRLGGLQALAVMFNQNTPEVEQSDFNETTYLKFVRDIPYLEAVERDCWE